MVAGVHTEEFTSTVSVEKLWKAGVDDAHNLLPMLLPHIITSVEVIEGSGGPGTLKKFTFTDVVEYKSLTDRVDIYDPANHLFKHSVVEGGLLGTKLKSLVFEIKVEAAGEGGCLVKVKAEYDSIDDGFPTAEEAAKITGNVVGMIKAVEGYLLAN
ncbi:Major pollen allergen Bet v 1-M/N [Acorus calamus]|uniref:Major pollen allergen Bet v 1-M/N n=1 Tax=Acorus calamus TaxID=4465 RepID=A0AAV9D0N6_ACOCL|nr:Major pollen allergen Bet v 1-M/N [Acorus calamus]KAK1295345.1 Major pollen allergen Bet v 1-M/N [Acorus calamus]